MFVVTSIHDKFTHRVGDLDSLEDLIFGLTDNMGDAMRIVYVAKYMNIGDVFVTNGVALFNQEDK